MVSEPILAELARVFSYRYFSRPLSAFEIEGALSGLRTEALIQPITVQVSGVAPHPKDNLILATALSAQAPFLVTGDKRLLQRGAYRGTRLLSARQLLDVVDHARE